MVPTAECKHGLNKEWCGMCKTFHDPLHDPYLNRKRVVNMPLREEGSQTTDLPRGFDFELLDFLSWGRGFWYQSWELVDEFDWKPASTVTSSLVRLHRNGLVSVDRKRTPWRYRFRTYTL